MELSPIVMLAIGATLAAYVFVAQVAKDVKWVGHKVEQGVHHILHPHADTIIAK